MGFAPGTVNSPAGRASAWSRWDASCRRSRARRHASSGTHASRSLDEPLNALDAPAQAADRAVLKRHLAAGGLAIAATHADLGVANMRTLDMGSVQSGSSPPLGGEVG